MSFDSNWASPPGATISRLMELREIPRDELADGLALTRAQFDKLIGGEIRITETLASALADQLGSSRRLWLARDKTYLRDLARIGEARRQDVNSWCHTMPVASMKRYGWLSMGARGDDLAQELLHFFGCSDLKDWGTLYSKGVGAVAFKTSLAFEADAMATLVWLRAGERQASELPLPKFDSKAFVDRLPALKKLSAYKHPKIYFAKLQSACQAFGVALTSARAPEGCRASGASWLNASGNPVIHLSFRHLSEDHVWFTFFHEAAHVAFHGNSHIDTDNTNSVEFLSLKQEEEADRFAQEMLVPKQSLSRLMQGRITPRSVMSVARQANVTAGIIVGQLERAEIIKHGKLSFLKHRYRWCSDSTLPELSQPRKYS